MHEDFFTPGELARLCGISKSLLLYYDRQGILKPRLYRQQGLPILCGKAVLCFGKYYRITQAGYPSA